MEMRLLWLDWKAFHLLWALCAVVMMASTNAFEFKVGGGSGSWGPPSDPNTASYNQWAEKSRFQIGDTLLFVYDAGHDSVLQVTKEDYTNCNTASPIKKFADGRTVFELNQSGPFYFISGVPDNCRKNEKLHVVVMADRSKQKSNEALLPPPPAPYLAGAPPPPSLAPNGSVSPPPPLGVEVPPPSIAPSGEVPPPSPLESTPAPSQESSPPNGAASTGVSGVGILAAFVGSTLILGF